MKKLKSYFLFSREQRSGIFLLFCIVIFLQIFLYFTDFNSFFKADASSKEELEWLSMQSEIDSINDQSNKKKFEIAPFNPNFITDYKGYLLGLSTQEIDRLHEFRKTNKFVNSAKEFQKVTKVSDSLLKAISPKFKFPEWVTNKQNFQKQNKHSFYEKKAIVKKDINTASKEDWMEVYGIGDKISDIILQEKTKFGAFVAVEQLEFVWGITPEAFIDIKKRFFVKANDQIKKIDINNLSTKELAKFPYFKYALAKEIVTYRSMNGNIKNIEELSKINNFPIEKIQIIALYLDID